MATATNRSSRRSEETVIDVGDEPEGLNEVKPTGGTLAQLTMAERETAIATAKRYPRDEAKFLKKATSLCTLNREVAAGCTYALPRTDDKGKKIIIQGPTIRMAEIIKSAWGNIVSMGRIIDQDERFIVAQGVCCDLENNSHTSREVRRSIRMRNGRTFSDSVIVSTANAAISIAVRNSIFEIVPRALWQPAWVESMETAKGSKEPVEERRERALDYWAKKGISRERVFETLGVGGIESIGVEELFTLETLRNAVRDGETTLDEAFPLLGQANGNGHKQGTEGLAERLGAGAKETPPVDTNEAGSAG